MRKVSYLSIIHLNTSSVFFDLLSFIGGSFINLIIIKGVGFQSPLPWCWPWIGLVGWGYMVFVCGPVLGVMMMMMMMMMMGGERERGRERERGEGGRGREGGGVRLVDRRNPFCVDCRGADQGWWSGWQVGR